MNPLQEIDDKDEVKKFFTDLGYRVSWDFKRATGEYWYEIYDKNYLIAQIDMGVALKFIIQDLINFYGKGENSGVDYRFHAPHSLEFNKLMKKVYYANKA